MRKLKKLYALTFLLLTAGTVFAQEKGKLLSPKASAQSRYVSVTYGQPSKKGREIFGGLVPYGQVWRTGANEATEITFKKDGIFGGKAVKAGTYTLFTIPEKDHWTVILNSVLKQWGAFGYQKVKDKDVLHTDVPVKQLSNEVEKFTIKVTDHALIMMWDKTSVTVPMKF